MRTEKDGPQKHGPEEYRQLAANCREVASKASTKKERDDPAGQGRNLRLPQQRTLELEE
jgi:hypothetical protein